MPRDKTASHVKVMAAARDEFLEYGFENASMRRIGERSGLTAAGLYRHCRDKEDLFDQLVAPALGKLHSWMDTHLARYLDAVRNEGDFQWRDSWIDMMREVVYPCADDYRLLLTCSSGTKYESFLHDLALEEEKTTMAMMELLKAQGHPINDVNPSQFHLLVTANVNAVFQAVQHDFTREEALNYADTLDRFFAKGWQTFFGY